MKDLKTQGHITADPFNAVNRDEPLLKVAVVTISSEEFALVFSMNHAVADGHTAYTIYAGLDVDPSAPPLKKLTFQRNFEYRAAAQEIMGRAKEEFQESVRFGLGFVGFMITRHCRPAPKRSVWKVSEEWLAKQKEVAKDTEGVKFVSSNDVIASWWMNKSKFALFGTMSINLRGHVKGVTEDMAGNYENVLLFQKDEYATAPGIRKAFLTQGRIGTSRESLPSYLECASSRSAFITNWSNFFQEIRLPECQQIFHMPPPDDLPFPETCIVFRPSKDCLGVMLWERGGQSFEPGFGERIM
ncbi:unnamed protein product [Polarella glacialis]|uniref:Uncharacterized protein n=1 Tax=Polarella glacialis TaxID=89957 RepID=A0A813F4J8_POLGL|nr:unnamed protein product [Polarella glacialis]